MKKIRHNVFETNSSSSHSISIADESKEFVLDMIYPNQDGIITIKGNEFGWGWFKHNDALTKASYAAQQLDGSDLLKEVIMEQTGATSVEFVNLEDGYIDHESIGIVPDTKEELRQFIFNKNSWLFGGNDNSPAKPDFYIVPKYTSNGVIEPPFRYKLTIWGEISYFLEYPTDKDLEKILSNLNVRYNGTYNRLERDTYWVGSEVFYETNYNYKQCLDKGYVVLINEKVSNKLLEGKNWDERKEILKTFVEDNLDNLEVVYKLPFKIEKL